jgi:glycosyltransferase involved in cell wall biosynthesis
MKKILIITYYWPPSGGSGVQRWLKFVKYLTQMNYHCIIYTPENPEMPTIDNSHLSDIPKKNITVLKTKIIEPYTLYKKFTGKSSNEKITVSFLNEKNSKPSLSEKISKWIRGNIFIPDAKMLWIKPSVRYLTNYLNSNKVDAIISTGPPHSLHLIAYHLKKKFPNIQWIADFRDPWTNIDFLIELHLSKFAQKKHQSLENKVIQTADKIITVSYTLTSELQQKCPQHPEKFFTITNGFDPDDFSEISIQSNPQQFTLCYTGLLPANRNPKLLWKAIAELSQENKLPQNFKIQLIGKADASIWDSIKTNNIEQYIENIGYLPHSETLKISSQSNALLLIINEAPNSKGILTGKLFEYLALQKPILTIGPKDGDAAKIIYETQSGIVAEPHDLSDIKNALLNLFQTPTFHFQNSNYLKFSRKQLTQELIKCIESISH